MDQLQNKVNQLIQELQNTEKWLALSEERVRTLIKVIPAGLLITDSAGKIEAANSESERIFGLSAENLDGHNFTELLHSAEKNKQVLDKQNLVELVDPAEFIAKCQDGNAVPVQIQIREFSSLAERQFLVVVEDVSKRFEIERMKADFIAMISHDLRSPLTSISTFHELVAFGVYDDKLDELKQKCRLNQIELKRLISMINGLLDLERMDSGRFELLITSVECRKLIELSINAVESLGLFRQIQFKVSLPAGEHQVLADEKYILQVFVNLLSNALKFSPSGSEIEVSCQQLGQKQMKFCVADQGPGIKDEFRTRIFNKFEQAQISDSRIKGGSGLGLAFSKRIIDQHGGNIGVESKEGKGSTFWFTLPQAASTAFLTALMPVQEVPELKSRKVYLEKVVEASLERVELLAEDFGITLEASGTDAIVLADNDLLIKIISSLLLLVIKTAEKGCIITLTLATNGSEIQFSMSQHPSSNLKNQESAKDNDLDDDAQSALNFCRQVVHLHNGNLNLLKDAAGRISVVLNLPMLESKI